MRVSTSMIYDLGVSGLQQHQQEQVQLQQQISSGRRVLTPADDPVGAATVLGVQQSQSLNDQYKANGGFAKTQLGLEESALADATSILQDAKTLAVYAGDASISNADRASLADQVESDYQQLLAIANRNNGSGQYLFSGFQGSTQPFAETSPGNVAYVGDAGQRQAQIGAARVIPINDSGEAVFRATKNGNGTFVSAASGANTGGGVISPGTVIDPSLWNTAANAKNFTIKFNVDNSVTPPVTTYDIVDNVNNVSLLTGAAPAAGPYLRTYIPGGTISLKTQAPPDTNATPFDFGATVSIAGAPAGGDSFTVRASTNQDVFTTLHNLVTTLRNGTNGSVASNASYQNALNSAMQGVDNSLGTVLTMRTGVGARLKEVDTAQAGSDDLSVQYSKNISDLQDLDMAKAISDLNQQQLFLQAAQQSFIKITSLNLFSLL
jgi:flagellar hook-associated protein 3 FlgL